MSTTDLLGLATSPPPNLLDPTAPAVLHVVIHAARDLLAKDLNGFSDPFVRVELGGIEIAATKVKERNLNPVWNEEFLIPLYDLPAPGAINSPIIKLDVRNSYKFGKVSGSLSNVGKQAFLGQVTLPLTGVIAANNQESEWFPLEKRSEKSNVRGEIQATLFVVMKAAESVPQPRTSIVDANAQQAPGHRRRASHFSVSELAQHATTIRNANVLECGSYT